MRWGDVSYHCRRRLFFEEGAAVGPAAREFLVLDGGQESVDVLLESIQVDPVTLEGVGGEVFQPQANALYAHFFVASLLSKL